MNFKYLLISICCLAANLIWAQNPNLNYNKFRQLKTELATPNSFRTASGAPGHEYYQQKADYKMNIELDDAKQIIRGAETITYHNLSPDPLTYLWIQLDQNIRAKDSDSYKISTNDMDDLMSFDQLERLHKSFDGGFNIEYVHHGDRGGRTGPRVCRCGGPWI